MLPEIIGVRRFSDIASGAQTVLAYKRKDPGIALWIGPAHNQLTGMRDELRLTEKGPKTADPNGMVRITYKFTQTVVKADGTKAEAITDGSYRIPVGLPDHHATFLEMRLLSIGISSDCSVLDDLALRGET